jgi:hypothetical protein
MVIQMSEKTQPKIIKLVKIKQWYIPFDADCYQTLVRIKVPLTKIHQDFLPTLQLATGPRNIRAVSVPFSEIFNEKLDKVGSVWLEKPDRKCKITETRSSFVCDSNERNRKAIASLDNFLKQFCARWAFRYSAVFSETPSKLKLVVDHEFDQTLSPCVPSTLPVETSVYEVVLGFTKITVTTERKKGRVYNHLTVATQAGGAWIQVHTGSFIDVGDQNVLLLLAADLVNQSKKG